MYQDLHSTGQFEQLSQTTDEEEHSIEMHLAYVAKVMEARRGSFTIVPVLVGALKQQREVAYGRLFSKYLADPENLFVISSDFCHWGEQGVRHVASSGEETTSSLTAMTSRDAVVMGSPTA